MTVNLERLKKERKKKGLTQDEMAEKMGWNSRSPYAKRENGFVSIGADELTEMVKILGFTEDDLRSFFYPERSR